MLTLTTAALTQRILSRKTTFCARWLCCKFDERKVELCSKPLGSKGAYVYNSAFELKSATCIIRAEKYEYGGKVRYKTSRSSPAQNFEVHFVEVVASHIDKKMCFIARASTCA
jgi:hypothetical protein